MKKKKGSFRPNDLFLFLIFIISFTFHYYLWGPVWADRMPTKSVSIPLILGQCTCDQIPSLDSFFLFFFFFWVNFKLNLVHHFLISNFVVRYFGFTLFERGAHFSFYFFLSFCLHGLNTGRKK